ncbi:hypothetical protein LEP48_14920 [Isoptericola sp. NEAU-Y5]|uniref:Uncharacterized protein n=1 Tax=Isoptericola luteus TaxID=2879484 RepID=A0ABS7ZHX4_9MICO|nr:hypothetical protein [Isoptericola sp. NEAU-Y5]MCA5894630.1 hypothetical protein [Isoptericola sp. NEAU-Y5]
MTGPGPLRWALLFDDLEARFAAEEAAEREGVVAELTRAEQASIPLTDRLRAAIGTAVRCELADGEGVDGRVVRVADSWLLLDGQGVRGRVQHLVPRASVSAVVGLGRMAVPSGARTDRLGLGHVLRGLQRDRSRVLVRTRGGAVVGRIGRVGADHLDVEETDRARPVVSTVPFAAVLRVSEA